MRDVPVINVVGTACAPADVHRFNNWYAGHIQTLLAHPGMTGVSRFERIGSDERYPPFLAIYQFANAAQFTDYNNSELFLRSEEDRIREWGPNGFDVRWRVQYRQLGTWTK